MRKQVLQAEIPHMHEMMCLQKLQQTTARLVNCLDRSNDQIFINIYGTLYGTAKYGV